MRIPLPKSTLSRSVLKAMGLFGSLQMLTILCSMVRVKCVALWIGPEGIGLFTIFNAAITLVSTFTQLNLRTSSIREIAAADNQCRQAVAHAVRRLSWLLGGVGALVIICGAPIFSHRTFSTGAYTLSFAVLAVAVQFNSAAMGEQAVMQGLGALKRLARSTFWANLIGLIGAVALVWCLHDSGIIPSIIVYSLAGYLFARIFTPRMGVARQGLRETFSLGGAMLRLGAYMTVATTFTELLNYILITVISRHGSPAEVGIYQSGYTMVNRYVGLIFAAIGTEFYPRLSAAGVSLWRQRVFVNHEVRLLLLVITPVIIVFIPLVGVAIRLLYSSEFIDATPYVILALPGMVARVTVWCQTMVVLARGDGRRYIFIEMLTDSITLALSLAAYMQWGIPGLGAAFSVSTLIAAGIVAVTVKRAYGVTLPRSVVMIFASSLALTTAAGASALIFIHF